MNQHQRAASFTYGQNPHLTMTEFAKQRYERQKKKRDERKAFRELVKEFTEIVTEIFSCPN